MARTRSSRRTSARAITYVVLNRFNGGIDAHPDKVQIPLGSTPMARNVEWFASGGFFVRKGVAPLLRGPVAAEMAAPGEIVTRFHHYVRDPDVGTPYTSQYLIARADGSVAVGVDLGDELTVPGAWQELQLAGQPYGTVGPPAFVGWDRYVYMSLGQDATDSFGQSMVRWDGATATALGRAWANDYAAPTGGNMPPARYLAAWAERMWTACLVPDNAADPDALVESSTIRWSHPGKPEDWAEADYIEVGQQGDVITGIAPMRDMLLVFKRSSTYALLGSGATNFRVVEVSGTIGCTGEWTRDNQGSIIFWDATVGACSFDGKEVVNIFRACRPFLDENAITRCGGVVTDGDKVYVATDFQDFYGQRVPDPLGRTLPFPRDVLDQTTVTWQDLIDNGITWGAMASLRWLRSNTEFYNIVWVYRPGAGWTTYSLDNPEATSITTLGQLRSRIGATGDVQTNRRIVYALSEGAVPLYQSDRYDDGTDWWEQADDKHRPIDAFYMTPWLHGGLPAQIKRFKAPRVIQEADQVGVLLIDVFYDFNYDFLRRTLKVGVVAPLSFDSFSVGKPGTLGRAKAVMLIIRPEHPRHWGISSITIPVHPKVLR